MAITQKLNSKANIKNTTDKDIPYVPALPVAARYEATSTAAQTVINLTFSVDQANTDTFLLYVDGKLLRMGASNDYTFTSIAVDNTSSQVTLNYSIAINLNIIAIKLATKKETEFGMDNRFVAIYAQLAMQPTIQKFLSGSGTYTTPTNVKYLKIKIVGGGAGGSGGGSSGVTGGNGGSTTFGTSLLTATGGTGGIWQGSTLPAGGTATVNSPAVQLVAVSGGSGTPGTDSANAAISEGSGPGGASFFGGNGGGATVSYAGGNAAANSGSGGGGGGSSGASSFYSGGTGGGAGGGIEAVITGPSATYAYSVGTGGTGGASGGAGTAGGNGGSGVVIVEEYYV